jgi:hypothetical protein
MKSLPFALISASREVDSGLQTKRDFLDFVINNRTLVSRMNDLGWGHDCSVLGVGSWANAQQAHRKARDELLLRRPSDLPDIPGHPPGFVALYVCGECGDPYCGVIKVKIERTANQFVWSDFQYDHFMDEEPPIPIPLLGPFAFDAVEYTAALEAAELVT